MRIRLLLAAVAVLCLGACSQGEPEKEDFDIASEGNVGNSQDWEETERVPEAVEDSLPEEVEASDEPLDSGVEGTDEPQDKEEEIYGWSIAENGISRDGREHTVADRYSNDESIGVSVASEADAYLTYFSRSEEQIALDYTHDGGETWETAFVDTHVGVGNLYPSFPDEKTGYLLYCSDPGAGMMTKIVYCTLDGGKSFEKICDLTDTVKNYPIGMAFCDRDNGMMITQNHGDESYAFRTEDGGKTWNKYDVDVPDADSYHYIDGADLKRTEAETETWVLKLRGVLNNGERRFEYISTDHWRSWQLQ